MSILQKILGNQNKKVVEKIRPMVDQINGLEKEMGKLTDEKLSSLKQDFKSELLAGKKLDDILPKVFAAVREASIRTLGQRHFDVQLIGGAVLHRGQIAEMKTGEGKTLTSTLAVYLNSLEGKGVHVVTVNDYLARRDTVWMGQIYHRLGMSVGCIQHEAAFLYDPEYSGQEFDEGTERDEKRDTTGSFKVEKSYLRPVSRKEAYQADITYGTNNEFGFDYLRDNMAYTAEQAVQRDLHYAIVDEIDSILIDEARTPLIISAPDMQSSDMYIQFARLVKQLKENEDFNIDEKMRSATLTDAGINKMEEWLGMGNMYTQGGITLVHHVEQALRAETLFKRDKDYVVKENEVVIVDEFTGRLMPGRRYSEGLHQAIEAKEGVQVQRESRTMATITFQNYFRMYKKLAGMTGTAATEAEEFSKIYNLEVTTIPTNKPMIRKDHPDRIYKNEKGKLQSLAKEVKERSKKGQPVLIGTISIEKNEIVAEYLRKEGLEPEVLNAKNHEREGQIIAQAGKKGAITVATNMAGRGVDIILGGNPPVPDDAEKIRELGGLHVIGTERHESRRIDNQLRGRSGRQGDMGSTQFFVCTDDDLMRIFGSERMKKIMETLKIPDDMPIENRMITKSLETAQKKVEGHNFDIRKHLVEYDDVINKHREAIYRKRNEVLDQPDVRDIVLDMIDQEIEQIVSFHTASDNPKDWNVKEIRESVRSMFQPSALLETEIDQIGSQKDKLRSAEMRTRLIELLKKLAIEAFDEIEKTVIATSGDEKAMKLLEKRLLLQVIDTLWIEHLEAMDSLRRGIGLRGYGQTDPLAEYKKEAFRMFSDLMAFINRQVVYGIYKIGHAQKMAASVFPTRNVQYSAPAKEMQERKSSISNISQSTPTERQVTQRQSQTPLENQKRFDGQKVGRNEPCPCGSGLKYKKCHGA